MKKPQTIDAYLEQVPAEQRRALQKLRLTIRRIVPKAEECISYGIPAFRVGEGSRSVVAGFLARKKGCSYLPFSGQTLATLKASVRAYAQTKSSLHFDSAKGLPVALVRALVRTRLSEIAATR